MSDADRSDSPSEVLSASYFVMSAEGFFGVNSLLCLSLCSSAHHNAYSGSIRQRLQDHGTAHTLPDDATLRRSFETLFAHSQEVTAFVRRTPKVSLPGWEMGDLSVTPDCSLYHWGFTSSHAGAEGWWLSHGRCRNTGREVVLWLHHLSCGTETTIWLHLLIGEDGVLEWAVQTSDVEYTANAEVLPVLIGSPQRAVLRGVKTLKTADIVGSSRDPRDYVPYSVVVEDECPLARLYWLLGESGCDADCVAAIGVFADTLCTRCDRTVYPPLFKTEGEVSALVTHKGVANYSTGQCSASLVPKEAFVDTTRRRAQRLTRVVAKCASDFRHCLQYMIPTGSLSYLPSNFCKTKKRRHL